MMNKINKIRVLAFNLIHMCNNTTYKKKKIRNKINIGKDHRYGYIQAEKYKNQSINLKQN